MFDLTICGTSFFGGQDWFIPNPEQSFTLQTDLNSTVGNEMTLQFMKNLHNQTGRSFIDVVCDMGIITRMVRNGHERSVAHRLLAIAGQMIQSNVFLPADSYPSFPYPYPIKELSFLRLVFDMKCHLIYRAFMDLYDQGFDRYAFMHDLFCTALQQLRPRMSNLTSMVNLHQTLIGRFVSRVDKYTERGIVINGLPNYQLYKQGGILKSVDDLIKMSNGMVLFVRPDYYYDLDDSELETYQFDEHPNISHELDILESEEDHVYIDSVRDGLGYNFDLWRRNEARIYAVIDTQLELASWLNEYHSSLIRRRNVFDDERRVSFVDRML